MTKRSPWADDAQLMHPPDRETFGGAFERLVGIMARLRGPEGCPWDREQSLETLRSYLIEEAYEVLEAIEEGGVEQHLEELGDLLLQVVFQAELRRESGAFDAADVAHGISDKLVRRHPHVFADEEASESKEAFVHWERMKAKEKADRSVIDGVPRKLPSLLRAQRVQEKASRVGFDWPDERGPLAKVKEEIEELSQAVEAKKPEHIEAELGDLLFSVVNLSRFLGVGAEEALAGTIDRFGTRFRKVESEVKARGQEMSELPIEELEALWQAAKRS